MGFNGSYEYLCENGHHYEVSSGHPWFYFSEGENPLICKFCEKGCAFAHLRNFTNGTGKDYPESLQASKTEIGFDDEEKHDHYGNKYFIKHIKYKPNKTIHPDKVKMYPPPDYWIDWTAK